MPAPQVTPSPVAPGLTPATLADIPQIHRAMVDFYDHESLVLDAGVLAALRRLIENASYGQVYVIRSAPMVPELGTPEPMSLERISPDPGVSGLNLSDLQTPIGYCILTYGYSLELHGRTALVDELYLPPALRGQGLGTQVLQTIMQICREQGIRMLELEVSRDNPKARSLYERLGFRQHIRDILRFYPLES